MEQEIFAIVPPYHRWNFTMHEVIEDSKNVEGPASIAVIIPTVLHPM